MNSVNGMSAVNDIKGAAFGLFPAFYMNGLILWWNACNNDIDQKITDEGKLNFKVAHLYAYCRKDIRSFQRYYMYVIGFSFIPTIVVAGSYFFSEYSGVMRENGEAYGFDSVGMLNLIPIVISHHIVLCILVNNFDLLFFICFGLSFQFIWTIAWLDDGAPDGDYYKMLYTETFKVPLFWFQVFAGVAFSVIPIYAWLKYRQFMGGNPMHDINYQA